MAQEITTRSGPWASREVVHVLDSIFAPHTIAVIGASEQPRSVGRALLQNLDRNRFDIYPVNPNHSRVLGFKTYCDITAVPAAIDLAIIATPAPTVPSIIEQSIGKAKTAIIISAGFRECGADGLRIEKEIKKLAAGKMRIIGPNCLGVMSPHHGLNASFASANALKGNVGFISQSGALCTAILDWSLREKVGFSAFVSIGSMLDVSWGDLIYYLGDDPHTKSIVLYMESIGDARAFLSAAREVALSKPIIVLKVGRTEPASHAAASHTGSLTGSDEALNAAFRRVGVLRVDTIEELFAVAESLSRQPRPPGPRLAIITNAGGPGAVATDAIVSSGGELAPLSSKTIESLDKILPRFWSHGNPIDILGDASPERYTEAVEIVANAPETDGVLVILTPQSMTDPTRTAQQLKRFAHLGGKPLLASWMGGAAVEKGRDILNAANICTFEYPDVAARTFYYMWRYSYNLRGIYETPSLVEPGFGKQATRKRAEAIIRAGRKAQRTLLTEYESKKILEAYDIPTADTRIAFTKEGAVNIAHQLGFPVAVKLYSKSISHKTEVGGVLLDIRNGREVEHAWATIKRNVIEKAGHEHFLGVTIEPMIKREGYELILGSSEDPQFGPVLLFGSGGQLVEIFRDQSLGLPPLNSTLARRMMEQTRIYKALQGTRGRQPVDLGGLERLLIRFSNLVIEHRWIREIEINPLLASPGKLIALDARVVLHPPNTREKDLPKPAIRPYPKQYVLRWKLRNGPAVAIRPIRPEDENLLIKFHQTLSDESVYQRYFAPLKLSQRITHERLARICFNDYDREIALVADREDTLGNHEILGVGRMSKIHETNEAEFAIVVTDKWQGHGLGTEFLKLLIRIARDEKLDRLTGVTLAENHALQAICRKLGFKVFQPTAGDAYRAELNLQW